MQMNDSQRIPSFLRKGRLRLLNDPDILETMHSGRQSSPT